MNSPVFAPATPRAAALEALAQAFADSGIADPRREARLLLLAALCLEAADLLAHPQAPVGPAAERLGRFAVRRMAREPLSRINGRREFYGLDLAVTPDVLDPRPDTEILVEAVLDHVARRGMAERAARLLDLGTGSGAILAALLKNLPRASGIGTDVSEAALACASENLERHCGAERFGVLSSSWLDRVAGRFDIIVSNPPYIASGAIGGLDPEVGFDPRGALDGGADGLDAYRRIALRLPLHLEAGGIAAFETGAGQAPAVATLLIAHGLRLIEIRRDLAGIERVVVVETAS